ncbi:aromatic amino acid lyase [Actinotalea ferrariae]|uniref:aromatic amino acid lyase n=1 Tax=Actinotalea ferrariae TaxID=1386098 RepID=UPI001C8CA6E1|nr:aromatic amino acid lyase [Actinotalea ferrariae]MBX9244876.1 aromatic amino acid lyase [Actinotalea ferrariae]
MSGALARVVAAAASGAVAPHWDAARDRVRAERVRVERLIGQEPRPAVYGFTTLLGPLDHRAAVERDQADLLAAHLLGPARPVAVRPLRLVSACKAEQLAHGGSGVSSRGFDAVLDAIGRPAVGTSIAWEASYGSGDVVPAAWWAAGALGDDSAGLDAGDLIALINGTFVSTAVGVAASLALARHLGRFLAAASALVAVPRLDHRTPGDVDVEAVLDAFGDSSRTGVRPVQQSVSLRDARVLVRPAVTALRDLVRATEHRLGAPSANPLFVEDGGDLRAVSQDGFLDVTLTLRLVGAQQLVLWCAGATQRLAEAACRTRDGQEPDVRDVQPPKVVEALLTHARTFAAAPASYSGSQSGGVEDLWDGSLQAGLTLLRVLAVAEDQLAVLEEVLGRRGGLPASAPVTASLAARTGMAQLDVDAWGAGTVLRDMGLAGPEA